MRIFFKVDKTKRKRGRHVSRRGGFFDHAREWLWPSIGGIAFVRWLEIKIKRTKGSAYSIAMGLAAGAFASFTPFIGLHVLISFLICFLFKGNYIMAALGTIVGNPWTFPVIWLWTYNLGNFLLGVNDPHEFPTSFDLSVIFSNLGYYFEHFLWPMTIAGTPTGILVGLGVYMFVYLNLSAYRKAREKHLVERRKYLLDLKGMKEKITKNILNRGGK